ncbi:hypothetical protein Dimus_001497, partial [Dionaea muscipula]
RGEAASERSEIDEIRGVNRTSEEAMKWCKQRIEIIADTLQLKGFSWIDAFVNVDSEQVLVIEVNTVPGMTPSTVLIHQFIRGKCEQKRISFHYHLVREAMNTPIACASGKKLRLFLVLIAL